MIRSAILVLALAWSSAFAADPTQLVHEAALGWMQGAVKKDAAALNRFMADDLQYAHSGGQLETKQQYISAVITGPAKYESFTLSDLKIRFYGPKAAVLTAYCDVKMADQDSFRVRTLQVYVENNRHWQMTAHRREWAGRDSSATESLCLNGCSTLTRRAASRARSGSGMTWSK
jgi:hypothetical protein